MEIKDERIQKLIRKGYQIRLFGEEMNLANTGTYFAYCVSIEKRGIEQVNQYSLKSFDTALDLVFDLLKAKEERSGQTKLKL
ncbi:MAG TPA: hypothetical protein VMT35_18975 [Ignavibacteriaceae bacterium]|nr:hypothetical protein [Ignavibacteriaceae bacterium]